MKKPTEEWFSRVQDHVSRMYMAIGDLYGPTVCWDYNTRAWKIKVLVERVHQALKSYDLRKRYTGLLAVTKYMEHRATDDPAPYNELPAAILPHLKKVLEAHRREFYASQGDDVDDQHRDCD